MCEKANSVSSCNAMEYCSYNTTLNRCIRTGITAAFINATCGQCLTRIAAASGDADAMLMQQLVCPVQGTMQCFTAMNGQNLWKFEAKAYSGLVPGYCASPSSIGCLRKMLTAYGSYWKVHYAETYINCLRNCGNFAMSCYKSCAKSFAETASSVKSFMNIADNLCLKDANGTFCIMYTEFRGGCADALPTCNATCKESFSQGFAAMKCCAGVVNQYFTSPTVTPDDFPHLPNFDIHALYTFPPRPENVTIPEGSVAVDPGTNGAWDYVGASCGLFNSTWNNTFKHMCARSRSANTLAVGIPLPVPYSRIAGDANLLAKLLSALMNDLAAALGISPSDIINARLVEDTSTRLLASGRQSSVQQSGTLSGTKFTCSVQTESTEGTDAATAQYNTLSASNALAFPAATTVLTTECNNCLAAGASTVGGTPISLPPGTTSAAPVLSIALSSLIAVLISFVFVSV